MGVAATTALLDRRVGCAGSTRRSAEPVPTFASITTATTTTTLAKATIAIRKTRTLRTLPAGEPQRPAPLPPTTVRDGCGLPPAPATAPRMLRLRLAREQRRSGQDQPSPERDVELAERCGQVLLDGAR
jgi:hypothetical protein